MFSRKGVRFACAVALAAGLSVATAFAQTFDKRTLFTFSGPVTIPGVTLPAGKYLFRLTDPTAKVVQVLSADGTTPYGTFFAYPAERFEPASTPEIRFMETAKDAPAAIKTWWYPGERTGYEFIYPKDQARRLARAAFQPVLTTEAQTTTTDQTNTLALSRVSSTGEGTNLSADTKPTVATPTGAAQEGTIASSSIAIPNASTPTMAQSSGEKVAPAEAASTQSARTQLPKTASMVPVSGTVGAVAILGATWMYVYWRNRNRRTPVR